MANSVNPQPPQGPEDAGPDPAPSAIEGLINPGALDQFAAFQSTPLSAFQAAAGPDETLAPLREANAQRDAAIVEQRRIEAERGKLATFGTQAARGLLDAVLSPYALAGVAGESLGELTGFDGLRDFGREIGEAAQGDKALQAIAFATAGGGSAGLRRAKTFADVIEQQEKAWPLLSSVSRAAGTLPAALGAGGATAALGLTARLATGAVVGAAQGAQAGYEVQEPLRDVLTSTLLGATLGVAAEGAITGVVAGGRKLKSALGRVFGDAPGVAEVGGKEAHEVVTTLGGMREKVQSAVDAAGASPIARQAAESAARQEVADELATKAYPFNPANWETTQPTPIQKMVHRTEILDQIAADLSAAAKEARAAAAEVPGELNPARIAELATAADSPAAVGLIQTRVEQILTDIPAGESGDGVRQVLMNSLDKFERKGRTNKVIKMIDAIEDHLGPGVDPHEWIGKWSENGWKELGKKYGIRAPSKNTVDQVLSYYEFSPVTGRAKFNLAELPQTMAQGHLLAVELQKVSQYAAETGDEALGLFAQSAHGALINDLGSDLFGAAGKAYRRLWQGPHESFAGIAEHDVIREALQNSEGVAALHPIVAESSQRVSDALAAAQELTGRPQSGARETLFGKLKDMVLKADDATTLDGGPVARVFGFLRARFEKRAAGVAGSVVGGVIGGPIGAAVGNVVAESVRPHIGKILNNMKPFAKAAGKAALEAAPSGSAVGIALRGLAFATLRSQSYEDQHKAYDQRLKQIIEQQSDQDGLLISQAIEKSRVPADMIPDVSVAYAEKLGNYVAEVPKPEPSVHGPKREKLTRAQLTTANAMWQATVKPMSLFDDFRGGRVDYEQAAYTWRQYPGLQKAARAGVMDMLTHQLTDDEKAAVPDRLLTQLDLLLGMNGALSGSVDPGFSARMDASGAQYQQQLESDRASSARPVRLPGATPTFTERLSGQK